SKDLSIAALDSASSWVFLIRGMKRKLKREIKTFVIIGCVLLFLLIGAAVCCFGMNIMPYKSASAAHSGKAMFWHRKPPQTVQKITANYEDQEHALVSGFDQTKEHFGNSPLRLAEARSELG